MNYLPGELLQFTGSKDCTLPINKWWKSQIKPQCFEYGDIPSPPATFEAETSNKESAK